MSKWYERADEMYQEIVAEIRKVFRKTRLTLPFDSISSSKLGKVATTLYTILRKKNRKKYCDLCDYLWDIAWKEATGVAAVSTVISTAEAERFIDNRERGDRYTDQLSRTDTETVRVETDTVKSETGSKRLREIEKIKRMFREPTAKKTEPGKFDSGKFVDDLMRRPNPVTGYSYDSETDRKRDRFFESGIAHAESKNRREFENDFKRAESMWDRQTEQGFIDTEDAVRKKAYTDAGAQWVQWHTEKDERVCEECQAMEGMIFPVDRVPSKPHPRCRCWVTPVR